MIIHCLSAGKAPSSPPEDPSAGTGARQATAQLPQRLLSRTYIGPSTAVLRLITTRGNEIDVWIFFSAVNPCISAV